MDSIYLVQSTQKGSKYKYVTTEQEAKKYIQEKAEAVRIRLSTTALQKVYTTSDGGRDIKVLIQKVGNMWNGFLEEYVAFSYFPVNHISNEENEEKSESDSEEEDEGFLVRHLPSPKLGLRREVDKNRDER